MELADEETRKLLIMSIPGIGNLGYSMTHKRAKVPYPWSIQTHMQTEKYAIGRERNDKITVMVLLFLCKDNSSKRRQVFFTMDL